MTQNPPAGDARTRAVRTAAAHTAASEDLEAFLRQLPETPTPADIAEYANLVAREHAIRIDRDATLQRLGLVATSIEPE